MNNDVSFEHIAALEHFIEGVLPLLIDASPRRGEAIALLRTWEQRDTSVGEEVALGNLAEEVLKRLPSTG